MGFLIILVFALLFIFGFPVALAILIPAVTYIVFSDFPIELISQRMVYALTAFLSSRYRFLSSWGIL